MKIDSLYSKIFYWLYFLFVLFFLIGMIIDCIVLSLSCLILPYVYNPTFFCFFFALRLHQTVEVTRHWMPVHCYVSTLVHSLRIIVTPTVVPMVVNITWNVKAVYATSTKQLKRFATGLATQQCKLL